MSETVNLKIEPASSGGREQALLFITGAVEELGQREDWPDDLVFKVNLVLEEIGLNILSYGGESGDDHPELEIVIQSEDHSLTIEVSDDGRPFDPLEDAPIPVTDGVILDRPIGGLGIHLVKTMMDDLSYQHSDGKNRLIMVTRREE